MSDAILLLLKGLAIGIFVGLPIGPIGFLCIKRTITNGFWAGFLSGAGATLAHVFYGIIVITGLQTIISVFTEHQTEIAVVRVIVLLILGYIIFRYKKRDVHFNDNKDTKTLLACLLSSTLITLANPVQIVSFSATFVFLDVFTPFAYLRFMLILGIFLGSLLCWFILSLYVLKIRHRFSNNNIVIIHKICGIIIMFIGCFFLFKDFL